MQKRRLGNSDLDLTVIGFGAWAIGGDGWQFSWGPQDDADSVSAIHAALDVGINWIDTAHVYGHGHSEEVVGRAIKGRRDGVFVATKCGLLRGEDGGVRPYLKADSVREELEGSLRRLGVDAIDLYQIHWPNPEEDIEEAWEEINKARDEGLVKWAGVSNHNAAQMERLRAIAPVTSLQPPYSMLARGIEDETLPYCGEHHIGVVGYSPMVSGMLTGKVTREWVANLPDGDFRKSINGQFQEPKLSASIAFVDGVLKPIAEKHDVEPGQVAVAWVLRDERVTSAIVGARRPDQIQATARAADVQLDAEDYAAIEEGLEQRAAKVG